MKEQLISFETAKLAKEKGFDWEVNKSYIQSKNHIFIQDIGQPWKSTHEQFDAPTQSLLQKWLREEKRIYIGMGFGRTAGSMKYKFYAKYSDMNLSEQDRELRTTVWFKTYEEALEEGLKEALKLI